MDNINDMLKGVDPKMLEKSMEKAKAFVTTKEGKAFAQKYQGTAPADKNALLKILAENPELMKTLEKFFKE